MKKRTFFSILCLSLAVIMAGCEKDDEKQNNTPEQNPQEEVDPTSMSSTDVYTDGKLPGLFSVAEGKQVYFSKGNLQYQASTSTWRFATEQYTYIGADNENIGANYTGWIDLFAWGTSGWQGSGAAGYMPYSFSTETEDFLIGGASNNDLVGEYANADWGVYNAISNGGNQAGMWRTLTAEEWTYIFAGRTNAANLRCIATVCNECGVVILPDNWNSREMRTIKPNGIFTENKFEGETWTKMQSNGAVFLPAAGYRTLKSPGVMKMNGLYWSVNANPNAQRADYIYGLVFNTGYTDLNGVGGIHTPGPGANDGEIQRYLGASCRLVQDTK
ncbi:MAG: hypothetical protein IJ620_03050 [Bacteroidales bacterium]|nr:hypothetical protein [Bacteroidales bacterium]